MNRCSEAFIIVRRGTFLPNKGRDEVLFSKDFVHHKTERLNFIVIEAYKNETIFSK